LVTRRDRQRDGGGCIPFAGSAGTLPRELAVVRYLRDHVVPLLIGRDPHRIEDAWQYLYRGAYWRRGPVTMAAIAAVDVALWDIKA
jgi:mannonate dehydratase